MRLANYPLTLFTEVLAGAIGWSVAAFGGAYLALTAGVWIGSHGATIDPLRNFLLLLLNMYAASVLLAALVATALLWVFPLLSPSESLRQRVRAGLTILAIWLAVGCWVGHLLT